MPKIREQDRIVGLLLCRARRKKGLSMNRLAVLADLSQPYISELESGKKRLTASALMKLYRVLELSPWQLLGLMEVEPSEAVSRMLPHSVEREDLVALLEAFDAKGSMTTLALFQILAQRAGQRQ